MYPSKLSTTHLSIISVCLNKDALKTGFNVMNIIIVLQKQGGKIRTTKTRAATGIPVVQHQGSRTQGTF